MHSGLGIASHKTLAMTDGDGGRSHGLHGLARIGDRRSKCHCEEAYCADEAVSKSVLEAAVHSGLGIALHKTLALTDGQ